MSERFPGGVISKTAPVPTGPYENGTAPGIWTLEQQAEFVRQGIWPIAGNVPNYIEDVFSTWLYTGNGSTNVITNGIDLAGRGGLVWLKNRPTAASHSLFDSIRGATKVLATNNTTEEITLSSASCTFNSNGFTLQSNYQQFNQTNASIASWTFREQPKFFDVVTYTGTGGTRTVAHNLGSVPGCIIVKPLDVAENWFVYHRSLGATKVMTLNTTAAQDTSNIFWNDTEPTSTNFTVRYPNQAGQQYVAYLFAHNAGGFGLTGTDNVISCGSITTSGSGNATASLGYEPQFLILKSANLTQEWHMVDAMRGWTVPGQPEAYLKPNSSEAEASASFVSPSATGFTIDGWTANSNLIYIAIRRGPMKVPTTGTSVFDVDLAGNASAPSFTSAFPVDLGFIFRREGGDSWYWVDRLRGGVSLNSNNTAAEASFPTLGKFDYMNGYGSSTTLTNYTGWNFRRAPGFFDVVCYTGTGSAQNVTHNLTVAPELTIIKRRSGAGQNWVIGVGNTTNGLNFNTDPYFTYTGFSVTSTTFAATTDMSASGQTYVAYLFASAPGVSKVGSFTGTGATQVIDCGFTGGARFVLIKRTSGTGNWLLWDSARGIVAGNDPYVTLNTENAEVTNTDWVDTAATGFELSSVEANLANSSGVSYIFLAIA